MKSSFVSDMREVNGFFVMGRCASIMNADVSKFLDGES
jgi:hypothetical protein